MAHYEYDPFGNDITPTADKGSLHDSFAYRFSTKPVDSVTGWFYYGYRWYDPVTGRWPSRDPIEEEGGVDLYGFSLNDSINGGDILGLLCVSYKTSAGIGGFRKTSVVGSPRERTPGLSPSSAKGMGVGWYVEGEIDFTGEVCSVTCQDGTSGKKVSGSVLAGVRVGAAVSSYGIRGDLTYRWGKWSVQAGFNAWAGVRVYGEISAKAGAEVNYCTCNSDAYTKFKLVVDSSFGIEIGGEAFAYAHLTRDFWRFNDPLKIGIRLGIGLAGGGRVGLKWDADVECDSKSCSLSGPASAYAEAYIRATLLGFNGELGISGSTSDLGHWNLDNLPSMLP